MCLATYALFALLLQLCWPFSKKGHRPMLKEKDLNEKAALKPIHFKFWTSANK